MSKFDDIKIPDSIDDVTKYAIERGKNKKLRYKKIIKIASIVMISSFIGFPVIVRALPYIESTISNFIEKALPASYISKLNDENNANNIVIKDDKATITLEKATLDSQTFIASMIIESDFLKEYDESDLKYSLYAYVHTSIEGDLVGGGPDIIRKIADNKVALVVSAYVGDTVINDNVNINLNIKNIKIQSNDWESEEKKELKGNWNFSLDLEQEKSIQEIEVQDDININGKVMTFESLEVTPLASYIKLTYDESMDDKWDFGRYKIVDNNGKEYRYSQIDGHTENGKWHVKLAIYDDLSNIESLSITPYTDDTFIPSKIYDQDTVKMVTTMEANSEIEDIIVSRDVEKRDLDVDTKPAHKYEGSKISYQLDIDKNRKFYTIDELIGKEIKTGNQSSVTIEDINVSDKNTTVVLKANGDYSNLHQIVLFDENMKDTYSGVYVTHKGKLPSNTHWNNTKDEHYMSGLATFIIDKIDVNKKYKLAVPLQKEVELNKNYTMQVKMK